MTYRCKYNLYFYSSTATTVCNRNTVRESSHIYFLWRGPFLWSIAMAGEHTREADRSTWGTTRPLPFRLSDQWISPLRLSDHWISPPVQNYRDYIVFSSPMRKYEHPLRLTYRLVIGTYMLPFFPVLCWSSLRTEISVTLSIGNELYSRHHNLFFDFLSDYFDDVILRPHRIC